MKGKQLIAITGGIGSGKSLALNILNGAGYFTISCDQIVKDLYKTHKVKRLLKSLFPTAVSGEKRLKIDTKKIADITFFDKNKHKELTSTITPLVLEEVLKKASRKQGLIFVEVPLLFECGYQDKFDGVIVIQREINARIESVKKRSNLTKEQILARMTAQVDYSKLDLSNYKVIINDGDKIELEKSILDYAKSLK